MAEREVRSRPKLVCLLPARNCAQDLPGYFASVRRFADAVVALDDGSTDDTALALEQEVLVKILLRSPRGETYVGWDDADNRNRLLAAAAPLHPEWVLFLDVDERIDESDGLALRRFIETDALPGCAYGFRVFRMVEDLTGYDRDQLWVYRLFAYRPGLELAEKGLHFVPIPRAIPRSRWIRTTVRIQHIGGAQPHRRLARYEKYQEADPDNRYQSTYEHLLWEASPVKQWEPRPRELPVLWHEHIGDEMEGRDENGCALSAIIISKDDEDRIERSLQPVLLQSCSEPFEVIVVVSGTDGTARIVERHPEARLVRLSGVALPGRARNAGLRIAGGEFVSFPGSHVELCERSLEARLEAHRLGYAMVTGSVINGTKTRSGWASYFLDHSGSLPGRPSGELEGPPAHCSYDRRALLAVGGFPEGLRAGEETVVNNELWRRGYPAYRSAGIRLVHRSPCRNPAQLVHHHFQRGRSMGRILQAEWRQGRRTIAELLRNWASPAYVLRRTTRTGRQVRMWGGDLRSEYRRSALLVASAAAATWIGIWSEFSRPKAWGSSSMQAQRDRGRDTSRAVHTGLPVARSDPSGRARLAGGEQEGESAKGEQSLAIAKRPV
jgi:glycosyltransferase involved in cell wall biosynthesis